MSETFKIGDRLRCVQWDSPFAPGDIVTFHEADYEGETGWFRALGQTGKYAGRNSPCQFANFERVVVEPAPNLVDATAFIEWATGLLTTTPTTAGAMGYRNGIRDALDKLGLQFGPVPATFHITRKEPAA